MEGSHPKKIKIECDLNDMNTRNLYHDAAHLPDQEKLKTQNNETANSDIIIKVEETCQNDNEMKGTVETVAECARVPIDAVYIKKEGSDDGGDDVDRQASSKDKIIKNKESTKMVSRLFIGQSNTNQNPLLENKTNSDDNIGDENRLEKTTETEIDDLHEINDNNSTMLCDEEKEDEESTKTKYEDLLCGLGSTAGDQERKNGFPQSNITHVFRYTSREGESIQTIASRCHVKREVLVELNKNFIPDVKFTTRRLIPNSIILVPYLDVKTKIMKKEEWESAKVIAERKGKGFLISKQNGGLLWKKHLHNKDSIKVIKEENSFESSSDEHSASKASLIGPHLSTIDDDGDKTIVSMDIPTDDNRTENIDEYQACSSKKVPFRRHSGTFTNKVEKATALKDKAFLDFKVVKVEGSDVVITPDFPDLKDGDRISYIWTKDGNRYISRVKRWIKHSDDDFTLILCTDGTYTEVPAKEITSVVKVS